MTTVLEADDAAVKHWEASWTATATVLEGEEYKPKRGTPYARLVIRALGGGQSTLGPAGARRFRRTSNVLIQLFTPATGGTSSGADLAHRAREVFEGKRIAGMDFLSGRVDRIGIDGEWLMHLVTCPFEFHEIK